VSMDWSECIAQSELLLKEAAQDGAMASTQVERQQVRDKILAAQAYAMLAAVKHG
jgi:hypothetical protein